MLKNIFAAILIFLFVVLSVPLVIGSGANLVLSERTFYTNEFADISYDLFIEEFPEKLNLSKFAQISTEELRDIIKKILTKDDLTNSIDNLISNIKLIELNDGGKENIIIALPFIEKFGIELSEEISIFLYDNLNPCTSEIEYASDFFRCIPPELAEEDFKNRVRIVFERDYLTEIPKEISFEINIPSDFQGGLLNLIQSIIMLVMTAYIGFMVLLLIIISLLIFRPLIRVLKWNAKIVFFAGIFNILVLFFLKFLPSLIGSSGNVFLIEYLNLLISSIFEKMIVIVSLITIISLGVWILGIFIDRSSKSYQM